MITNTNDRRIDYVEFNVADIEDVQRRIEAAGGQISVAIFTFPGGRRFHFIDPDGYELAVWSKN